jgi:hypothetical protein
MGDDKTARSCCGCGARLARDNQTARCTPCQRRDAGALAGPVQVPSGFWADGLLRDALSAWHIGRVIRAYRQHPFHAGGPLSQEMVAGWLGLTQAQLSRIETGPPVMDLDKLIRWAQLLQIPAGLLWFRLPRDDGEADGDERSPGRSQPLVTLPPTALSGARMAGDPDAAAMQAFRIADLQVGGGYMYSTVVGYLRAVIAPKLLGPADAGSGVFTAASALTEMAGWMAHDAGHDGLGYRHFTRASELAAIGRDVQLKAHILASLSHLALHQGQPELAIRLARQGREALGPAQANPGLAAQLLAMEARGLAALPRPETGLCGEVLRHAEKTLTAKAAEPASPWISRFDEASLAGEAARSLQALGQLGSAARQAQQVLDVRPASHVRSRAYAQLLLASVLTSQRQPERACELARDVLDSTQSVASSLITRQLADLAGELAPYQSSQTVASFLNQLRPALAERQWLHSWLAEGQSPGETAGPAL